MSVETVTVIVDPSVASVVVGMTVGSLGIVDPDAPVIRGRDGRTPDIAWVGDRLSVDGVLGPHLSGSGGDGGSSNLIIGTAEPVDLAEAAVWVQTNEAGQVVGIHLCLPDGS